LVSYTLFNFSKYQKSQDPLDSSSFLQHFQKKFCYLFRTFFFSSGNPHLADAEEGISEKDPAVFFFKMIVNAIAKAILKAISCLFNLRK